MSWVTRPGAPPAEGRTPSLHTLILNTFVWRGGALQAKGLSAHGEQGHLKGCWVAQSGDWGWGPVSLDRGKKGDGLCPGGGGTLAPALPALRAAPAPHQLLTIYTQLGHWYK